MGAELCQLLKETQWPDPKGTMAVPTDLPVPLSLSKAPVLASLPVPRPSRALPLLCFEETPCMWSIWEHGEGHGQ